MVPFDIFRIRQPMTGADVWRLFIGAVVFFETSSADVVRAAGASLRRLSRPA